MHNLNQLHEVAVHDRQQHTCHGHLVMFGQLAHNRTVQRNKARIGRIDSFDKDIARMHVSMEEVIAEHLSKENRQTFTCQIRTVHTQFIKGGNIRNRNTGNPFCYQHVLTVHIDFRNIHHAGACEVMTHTAGIVRFQSQVQLIQNDLAIVLNDF